MRTFVKFTGITDALSLAAVPEGGAAGFVVEVPSNPRNLPIDTARALADQAPSGVEVWAVTRDPTAKLIHDLFDEMGVDRIHVYGQVPTGLEFLETHHIVPSLPIGATGSGDPAPKVPPPEEHPILHLDLAGDPLSAGSIGVPDWEVCRALVDAHPGRKLVLGGGLSVQNVGDALQAVRPWGVDVSAAVERAPGAMDPNAMRAFVAAVLKVEPTLG